MASILLPDGIKLLSGAEANRASVIPDVAEPLVTTDERRVFLGDNATAGGNEIAYARSGPNGRLLMGNTELNSAMLAARRGHLAPHYHLVVEVGNANQDITVTAQALYFVQSGGSSVQALFGVNVTHSGAPASGVGTYRTYVVCDEDGANPEVYMRLGSGGFAPPRPMHAEVGRNYWTGAGWAGHYQRGNDVNISRVRIVNNGTATTNTAVGPDDNYGAFAARVRGYYILQADPGRYPVLYLRPNSTAGGSTTEYGDDEDATTAAVQRGPFDMVTVDGAIQYRVSGTGAMVDIWITGFSYET